MALLFLVSLTAVNVNLFIYELKKHLMQKRIEERKGIIAAFKTIDSNGLGFIRFTQFYRLFKVLYPKVKVEQVNLLFNSLDEDNTKKIDLLEFLELPTILLLRIKLMRNWDGPLPWIPKKLREFINKVLPRKHIHVIVTHKLFNFIIMILICCNVLVSCLYYRGMPQSELDLLVMADDIFLILFVIEALLKIVAYGIGGYFKSGWNRFDFAIVAFGSIFAILQSTSVLNHTTGSVLVVGLRLVRLVRIIRVLRLLGIANRFKILAHTFIRLSPILFLLCILTIVILYIYTIIGMEAFSHRITPVLGLSFDPQLNFNNLGSALFTMYVILFYIFIFF